MSLCNCAEVAAAALVDFDLERSDEDEDEGNAKEGPEVEAEACCGAIRLAFLMEMGSDGRLGGRVGAFFAAEANAPFGPPARVADTVVAACATPAPEVGFGDTTLGACADWGFGEIGAPGAVVGSLGSGATGLGLKRVFGATSDSSSSVSRDITSFCIEVEREVEEDAEGVEEDIRRLLAERCGADGVEASLPCGRR